MTPDNAINTGPNKPLWGYINALANYALTEKGIREFSLSVTLVTGRVVVAQLQSIFENGVALIDEGKLICIPTSGIAAIEFAHPGYENSELQSPPRYFPPEVIS